MIAAIAFGIGACMTTLTVFRAMSADPIPAKSHQLFAPQIQNSASTETKPSDESLSTQLTYLDAMALMQAHAAKRQSALYLTDLALRPPDATQKSTYEFTRAAFSEFFGMFDVPFQYGSGWSAQDDADHAAVVVLSSEINNRVFHGDNSVGRSITLDKEAYRVVGVLKTWKPIPHFYDLHTLPFGESDEMFIPFSHAIDKHLILNGSMACPAPPKPSWEGTLQSECSWVQFWVELPMKADADHYRAFLNNYASEQRTTGRFTWPAHTQLRDVPQWLAYNAIIPSEVNILIMVSLGFLLVCLMNATGLMLAKIMGRAGDIGVRRALGASRRAIVSQFLIETGVVGLAGGLLGLLLTAVGLLTARSLLPSEFVLLTHLDAIDTVGTVLLAITATMLAGLYPTWRAMRVQPAWALKAAQ
ncbi:MAG TPA: ABC transporter permease [Steroidobacteraceae bacterium]|nr:ABC transporter permease [Steroidobacteraceae bacterium]